MAALGPHGSLPIDDTEHTTSKKPTSQIDPEAASERLGQIVTDGDATNVGAFGAAAAAGGKQFRVLGKWKTGVVLIHTEVGIGILALPSVLQRIGLIPGLIAILGIGILSTYTAYVLLLYWRRYPHIDNLPDALRVLGGKVLAAIGAVGLIINLSLACSSATLAMSVALNTLTNHGMCTVAFIGFSALVCFVLCIPRTMNFVAYISCKRLILELQRWRLTSYRACYHRDLRPHLHCHHLISCRLPTNCASWI